MARLSWDSSYSVKVEKCDEDHKKLFALLNQLLEAISAGKGYTVIGKAVKELDDYAKSHFSAEEKLMAEASYPILGPHRAQHQMFIQRVQQFQKDVDNGTLSISIAVVSFLQDWLVNHIQHVDQQYSGHLNAHGIC